MPQYCVRLLLYVVTPNMSFLRPENINIGNLVLKLENSQVSFSCVTFFCGRLVSKMSSVTCMGGNVMSFKSSYLMDL